MQGNRRVEGSVSLRSVPPDDARFLALVTQLDAALAVVNGDKHDFYTAFSQAPTLDLVLLLTVGEEAVGCGGLRARSSQSTEVKRMFVRDDYRGRGFAQAILAALEAEAREAGFAETLLETSVDLHPAQRLYERTGYRVVPNFEPYVGQELSVCYGKRL